MLRIVNGSKIYGGVHAIEGVNFDLYPGEVHALVGENGAGKSTLCKAIAGAIKLTSGDYLPRRQAGAISSSRATRSQAGICMVYQETSLVPTMTAAQNIELGNEKLLTRFRTLNIQAQQLLQSLNFHVDPATPVGLLGTAKRQMVEIARAIYNKARIIIFDEPTASLTPEEIVHFFHLVRDLRARGVGDHLHFACAGGVAADRRPHHRAARRQAGGHRADRGNDARHAGARHGRPRHHADPLCAAQEKTSRAPQRAARRCSRSRTSPWAWSVKNMSFSVYAGEVVGIAGLIGSGRTEIAKIIFGALKRNLINGGTIKLRGKPIRYRVPKQAINDGIAYITEDRKLTASSRPWWSTTTSISASSPPRRAGASCFRAHAQQARRLLGRAAQDQRTAAQSEHRRTLRRQPAEGGDGEIAGAGSVASSSSTSRPAASMSAPSPRSIRRSAACR